jgi:hypothetical protein
MACGRQEASLEDLRAALTKSVSLASETETFVEYQSQGRSTINFAAGHLHYLRGEVDRTSQEVSKLHSDPARMNAVSVDLAQLRLLEEQIDAACRNLKQSSAQNATAARIREIRIILQQTSSSL